MITLAHQGHPELSILHLCELLDVSRSWYYERDNQADADPEDITDTAMRSSGSSWSSQAMGTGG